MDNKIPVLSVYDKDGNRIEIPAVAGRSAYAEAVAQGYTGTREEFGREQAEFAANAAKVASDRNAVEQAKSDTEQIKSDALTEVEAEKDATVQAVQDEGAVQIAAVRNAAEAKKNEIAGLDAVQFISQDKTDEEKTQARVNIDAASQKEVDSLSEAIADTVAVKAEIDADNIVSFKNSVGKVLFTLDLSDLSSATYGEMLVSVVDVSITEGESGTFTVKLATAPSGTQTVYLAVSDNTKVSVEPATLSFTADDYDTAQTVTVTALDDTDESDESVSVSLTSKKVEAKVVAITISDDDKAYEVITDGLALYADYTSWDGTSATLVDKAGGVTLKNMSTGWQKVTNGIRALDGASYKYIEIERNDDAYTNLVDAYNSDELTFEWFGNFNMYNHFVRATQTADGAFNSWLHLIRNSRAGGTMVGNIQGGISAVRPYFDTSGSYQFAEISSNYSADCDYRDDFMHLVTVFDKSGGVKMYHNGVLVKEAIYENFASWVPMVSDGDFLQRYSGLVGTGSATVAHDANAWLSSQRLYTRALTADEIIHNMHAEGERLGLSAFI